MEDKIKRLQVELKSIRNDNGVLRESAECLTGLRREIIHVQRDLVISNLKCQQLEDDLRRPINVHRWRNLESKNSRDLEQLKNYQILQRFHFFFQNFHIW